MVLNFPMPYPDESLYSIVSRYFDYYGTAAKEHLHCLFSTSNQSATIDFPNNLKELSQNISSVYYTPENILNNHTLFPLYNGFLTKNKSQQLAKSALGIGGNIHTTIGINAGLSKSLKHPRFCRKCYENDLKKYGESYFRRAHQIPLITICLEHQYHLEQLPISPETLNKHHFLSTSLIAFIPECHVKLTRDSHLQKIEKRIISLLNPKEKHIYDLDIYFYKNKLQEIGFKKGKCSIDLNILYESFSNHFTHQTLIALKSEINSSAPKCWLKYIVRKHRKSFDPIRHVLMEDFIIANSHRSSNTIESSIKNQKWPCINPVCIKNGQSILPLFSTHFDSKSKRRILTIKCDCGFIYTESKVGNDIPFRRVKTYGSLWENELYKLRNTKLSIRSIAKQMNCDSKTIIHHTKKSNSVTKKVSRKEILLNKKKWIQLKNTNPKLSISNLRSLGPSIYIYLYRNDKDWLLLQKYPHGRNKNTDKVNWKERDKIIGNRIMSKYHYLLSTGYKKRISKSLILKLTEDEQTYYKNSFKLPDCSRLLAKYEESIHQHQIRRIEMAVEDIKNQKITLKAWRIYRMAGIRKAYITEEIEAFVLQIIIGQTLSKINIA